jgi:DNA-binding XRE family transcriptional regulator
MLELAPALTSTPAFNENASVLGTLPIAVTGEHLKTLRNKSGMSPSKFASLLGVSPEWLRLFENGKPARLSQCLPQTQIGVALGVQRLGVRLTETGWVLLKGDG